MKSPLNRLVMSPKKVNVGVATLEEGLIRPFNENMKPCKIPLRRHKRKKVAVGKAILSEPKVQGNEISKAFTKTDLRGFTVGSSLACLSETVNEIARIEEHSYRAESVSSSTVPGVSKVPGVSRFEKEKHQFDVPTCVDDPDQASSVVPGVRRFEKEKRQFEFPTSVYNSVQGPGKIQPIWYQREADSSDYNKKQVDFSSSHSLSNSTSHELSDSDSVTERYELDTRSGTSAVTSFPVNTGTVRSNNSTARSSDYTEGYFASRKGVESDDDDIETSRSRSGDTFPARLNCSLEDDCGSSTASARETDVGRLVPSEVTFDEDTAHDEGSDRVTAGFGKRFERSEETADPCIDGDKEEVESSRGRKANAVVNPSRDSNEDLRETADNATCNLPVEVKGASGDSETLGVDGSLTPTQISKCNAFVNEKEDDSFNRSVAPDQKDASEDECEKTTETVVGSSDVYLPSGSGNGDNSMKIKVPLPRNLVDILNKENDSENETANAVEEAKESPPGSSTTMPPKSAWIRDSDQFKFDTSEINGGRNRLTKESLPGWATRMPSKPAWTKDSDQFKFDISEIIGGRSGWVKKNATSPPSETQLNAETPSVASQVDSEHEDVTSCALSSQANRCNITESESEDEKVVPLIRGAYRTKSLYQTIPSIALNPQHHELEDCQSRDNAGSHSNGEDSGERDGNGGESVEKDVSRIRYVGEESNVQDEREGVTDSFSHVGSHSNGEDSRGRGGNGGESVRKDVSRIRYVGEESNFQDDREEKGTDGFSDVGSHSNGEDSRGRGGNGGESVRKDVSGITYGRKESNAQDGREEGGTYGCSDGEDDGVTGGIREDCDGGSRWKTIDNIEDGATTDDGEGGIDKNGDDLCVGEDGNVVTDDEDVYGIENDDEECVARSEIPRPKTYKVYTSKSSRLLFLRANNKEKYDNQPKSHGVKSEGDLYGSPDVETKCHAHVAQESRTVPPGAWRTHTGTKKRKGRAHQIMTYDQKRGDYFGDRDSTYDSSLVKNVSDYDECCSLETESIGSSQLELLSFQEVEENEANFTDLEGSEPPDSAARRDQVIFDLLEQSDDENYERTKKRPSYHTYVRKHSDNYDNLSMTTGTSVSSKATSVAPSSGDECDTDGLSVSTIESPKKFIRYWGSNLSVSFEENRAGELFKDRSVRNCRDEDLLAPSSTIDYLPNCGTATDDRLETDSFGGSDLDGENVEWTEVRSLYHGSRTCAASNPSNGAVHSSEHKRVLTGRKTIHHSNSSPVLSPSSNCLGRRPFDWREGETLSSAGDGRSANKSPEGVYTRNIRGVADDALSTEEVTDDDDVSVLAQGTEASTFQESVSPTTSLRRGKDLKKVKTLRSWSRVCHADASNDSPTTAGRSNSENKSSQIYHFNGDLNSLEIATSSAVRSPPYGEDPLDNRPSSSQRRTDRSAHSNRPSPKKVRDSARKNRSDGGDLCVTKLRGSEGDITRCTPKRQMASVVGGDAVDQGDSSASWESISDIPKQGELWDVTSLPDIASVHSADLDDDSKLFSPEGAESLTHTPRSPTKEVQNYLFGYSLSQESHPDFTSAEYLERKRSILEVADIVLEHSFELSLDIPISEENSPTSRSERSPTATDKGSITARSRSSPKHQTGVKVGSQVMSKKEYMEMLRANRNRRVMRLRNDVEIITRANAATDVVSEAIVPLTDDGTIRTSTAHGIPRPVPAYLEKRKAHPSKPNVLVQCHIERNSSSLDSASVSRKPIEDRFWEQQAKVPEKSNKHVLRTGIPVLRKPRKSCDESFWVERARSDSQTLLSAALATPVSPVGREPSRKVVRLPPLREMSSKRDPSLGIKPSSHLSRNVYDFNDRMETTNGEQNRSEMDEKEEEFSSPENVSHSHRSSVNKFNADSAYSSLNRKSPLLATRGGEPHQSEVVDSTTVHFERLHLSSSGSDSSLPPIQMAQAPRKEMTSPSLKRVSPPRVQPTSNQKMSKFCHECGYKFPLTEAKFCCECGVRRLLV